MSTRRLRTCLLALSCLAAAGRIRALSLEAGAARADITPPSGLHMQGYPDPDSKRIATGVRDPLYALSLIHI